MLDATTDEPIEISAGERVDESFGEEEVEEQNHEERLFIEWTDLSLVKNGKTILDAVEGRAQPGELAVIMGHSGSGTFVHSHSL